MITPGDYTLGTLRYNMTDGSPVNPGTRLRVEHDREEAGVSGSRRPGHPKRVSTKRVTIHILRGTVITTGAAFELWFEGGESYEQYFKVGDAT